MSLRIAITGSTGLIGSQLVPFFLNENHEVTQITRRKSLEGQCETPSIVWDPDHEKLDAMQMEGMDVVIHLAGTNVGVNWSNKQKNNILYSRINSTRLLCKTLARLRNKPKVLLSASAIGFYGNQLVEKELDENSPKGNGFLSDVCKRWEDETMFAQEATKTETPKAG